jgi:tetratricopeptide (TPR) repeat protein
MPTTIDPFRLRLLVPLALLVFIEPARAEEDKVRAALKLAREGQVDRAEKICEEIRKDRSSSPDARSAIDFVRAEVLLSRSETETRLEPALKILDESLDLLRSFIRAKPPLALAAEANQGMDWRILRKATRAATALSEIRPTEDKKKREDLLKLTTNLHEASCLRYRERVRDIKSADSLDEHQLAELSLDGARALLQYARLPGLEEGLRKSLLAEAVGILEDVELEYGEEACSFEAMWLEGLCHLEQGEQKLAEDRLQGATTLLARLRESNAKPGEYHLRVSRNAYLSLSDAYLRSGKFPEAAKVIDAAFREDPAMESDLQGSALRLQKAEALFREGDLPAAHALATRVMNSDPDGKVGAAAREKMRTWSADGRALGGKVSPERLLIQASVLLESESFSEAIATYQTVVDAPLEAGADTKHRTEALFGMGECLSRMGRQKDAAAAFQRVFEEFPEHELAPRACFEAVRALASAPTAPGEKGEDDRKEAFIRLLQEKWPGHAATRNVAVLQAEQLERDKQFAKAAELFLTVPEDANGHEGALVGAARCYFLQAAALWETRKDGANAVEAAKASLAKAEDCLARFQDRISNPAFAPQGAQAARQRAALGFQAMKQLALVLSHEAIARHEDALLRLEAYASSLPPEDPRLATILALKVRPSVALGKTGIAVSTADTLLEKFPDNPAILSACRTAAGHLEEQTKGPNAPGDPAALKANLERIHRYYHKWLRGSIARGARIGGDDAVRSAETLFQTARAINGVGEKSPTFSLAHRTTLEAPRYFANAAEVLRLLAEGKVGPLGENEKLQVMLSLARSEAFLAGDSRGWERARTAYLSILNGVKLVDEQGKIKPAVLAKSPGLLISAYLESGVAGVELAKSGQVGLFDSAITVFQNVQGVTESGSEPWWLARYLTVRTLLDRGSAPDLRLAKILLENVANIYPDDDGDRFGIKSRLAEVRSRLGK